MILCAALFLATTAQADECKAKLDPQLYRVIEKDTTILHRFKVDISSPARCADVWYHLKVDVEASGGKKEPVHRKLKTRVRDGVITTAMVEYEMPREKSMTGWEIEIDRCSPCGAGMSR
jgi:hypothetical protein